MNIEHKVFQRTKRLRGRVKWQATYILELERKNARLAKELDYIKKHGVERYMLAKVQDKNGRVSTD
tara:strand:- start:584 stop:781 length:198 start_codon:yes stop_codon:yes gene_type:complete